MDLLGFCQRFGIFFMAVLTKKMKKMGFFVSFLTIYTLLLHLCLGFGHFFVGRSGFFFCQCDEVVHVFLHPCFAESEHLLVTADREDRLCHAAIVPCVFGEYVVNGAVYQLFHHFFHESGDTELPFQLIAHQHHEVLCEALEHEQVAAHVVLCAATLLDAEVNFLEEAIADAIEVLKHLGAGFFLAHPQFVIHCCYMESALEGEQVGQCG